MKKFVAKAALEHFKNTFELSITTSTFEKPFVLGLGTGSTVAELWPLLADYLHSLAVHHVLIVPTSYQSRDMVLNSSKSNLPIVDCSQYPMVDCLVDGFDEAELQRGIMIKGGGGAHVLEKVIASCSRYNIYIGTADKITSQFGTRRVPIPIEVIPMAISLIQRYLMGTFGGECKIRQSSGKMGPVVTDLGNFILDWTIPVENPVWKNAAELEFKIQSLNGVVGCGLFVGLTNVILISDQDGRIDRSSFDRKHLI